MSELNVIRSKFNSEAYRENLEKIIGDKPPQRGRWKQDPETGKLLTIEEYYAKFYKPRNKAPMIFVDNMEPYVSPVSGEVVRNRREHKNDLDRSGCRVYEGRQAEQREADRFNRYKEEKFEKTISETVDQTVHEIEHGYRTPSESPETLNMTWEK
jgi:hypothetical protein